MIRPLRALVAVLAAFFGVRKGDAANLDRKLCFADIVTAAIVLVALLIALLLLLVKLVSG